MRRWFLVCLLGFISLALQWGHGLAQPGAPKIILKKDLVYGNAGDKKLELDLAIPATGKGPFPLIVCVHGGGWRSGKRQDLTKLIEMLAQRGFVAATVSYRLTDTSPFPAQIEDCKEAIRWLRANSGKYKINGYKVGAVGFSAGGHLVCLLGAADNKAGLEGNGGKGKISTRVQAVVSFFGPTDFINKSWSKEVEDFFLVPFFKKPHEKAKSLYRKGSPLNYVSPDDPPFLFIHGDKDELVGIHHSQNMMKKLKEVGVPAELVTVKGAGHGWAGKQLEDTLERTVRFFEEKLKK